MPSEDNQADKPLLSETHAATPKTPSATAISQTPPPEPRPQSVKKLIAGIVAAIVVFTGAAFLALSPMSPFVTPKPPAGPALMVGQHQYVYACSVFDADFAAATLGINADKNKQGADESYAFDPGNTKDMRLDILKTTNSKAIGSDCNLKFDKQTKPQGDEQSTTFTNVMLTLRQFGNEDDAKTYFASLKDQIGSNGKTLSSHKDSIYGPPAKAAAASDTIFIRPHVRHKNIVMNFAAPLANEDASGNQTAQKADKVISDIIKRINSGVGVKPKNFNGITKLAGHPFVDACQSVNYAAFAEAIGNEAQLDPSYIVSFQSFSPTANNQQAPPLMNSSCSLSYRTKTEIDSQKSMPANGDGFSSQFPHYAILQIYVTENPEQAKKFLTATKDSAKAQQAKDPKLKYTDIKLGDAGLKVTTSAEAPPKEGEAIAPKASYDAQIYYMAEGPYVYTLTNSMTRQNQPYKTTDQTFTDNHAKAVLKTLHKARLFAERTTK